MGDTMKVELGFIALLFGMSGFIRDDKKDALFWFVVDAEWLCELVAANEEDTMPYVDKDTRERLDNSDLSLIDMLGKQISKEIPKRAGEMNFVISSLIDRVYHPMRYNDINEAIGVLECAKQELYRRIAAPYEDTKIAAHGDVYTNGGSQILDPVTSKRY